MRNRLSRALPGAVALLAAVAALPVSASSAAFASCASAPEPVPHAAPVDHTAYIVTVSRDVDPAAVAGLVGATPDHVFRTVLHGFAARLSPGQVAALHAMPGVESVQEDGGVSSFGPSL